MQPEAERRRGFPIHQQQILPPVAVHVRDLHGLGRAGIRDFLRFAESVVGLLRQKIQRAVVAEQNDVGKAVAVQIAGDERVGIHAPVLDVPALRLAPAVRALVVNDFEILRVAEKNEVRTAVAVHIGHRQRGDVLVHGKGINAEARVGRQFVDFQLARRLGGAVRLAGLVVKQVNIPAQIVDDDEIVQAVAGQIRRVQQGDSVVNRIRFVAGEAKGIRARLGADPAKRNKAANRRGQNEFQDSHKTPASCHPTARLARFFAEGLNQTCRSELNGESTRRALMHARWRAGVVDEGVNHGTRGACAPHLVLRRAARVFLKC